MVDKNLLEKKLVSAKELIKTALDTHKHRVYIAYSGGKDSKAVLKMVRELKPNCLAIHNEHEGEICDRDDVLVIKGPKKEKVKDAMSYLDITAQIDGTRQDEDDFVMIDGVDIHRSKMNVDKTDKGVWGLEVYFPLRHFTEEEVYYYLNNY